MNLVKNLIFSEREYNRLFVITDEEKKVCFALQVRFGGDYTKQVTQGLSEELNADELIINEINYDVNYAEGTIELTSIEDGEEFQRKFKITRVHVY